MTDIDKIRKKIQKEVEQTFTVDEHSDFPIHERYTKESDIITLKKKKG
ncbi:MAG: hypothetical protein WC254_05880 [Candidatus Woesearchaeota archaeon]|jgi:hypothetical protein